MLVASNIGCCGVVVIMVTLLDVVSCNVCVVCSLCLWSIAKTTTTGNVVDFVWTGSCAVGHSFPSASRNDVSITTSGS